MNMLDRLEVIFWRLARHILVKGYGGDCKTCDLDDFDNDIKKGNVGEWITHDGRCCSCRAKETIKFIDDHIDLLRM